MVTGIRSRSRLASRRYRPTPYSLSSRRREIVKKDIRQRKKSKIALEKKDWEDATCSVCMEYPHNAVLLLCSSHEKGCRPYMCGTSYRYSNCLDQFKKAYTKVTSPPRGHHWHELANNPSAGLGSNLLSEKCEVLELACPLCRGQVKGMTVVEPAREYLNAKKRTCTQDDCSFNGTYKELRKHVKQEHPFARPREVDPRHEAKWRSLESEREHDDVLSTIQAIMPRARVFGDYVIEGGQYGFDTDDDEEEIEDDYGGSEVGIDDPSLFNIFFMYQHFEQAGTASFQSRLRRQRAISHAFNDIRERERERVAIPGVTNANGASVAAGFRGNDNLSLNGRHQGRMVGRERSERRRRRRSQRRTVLDGS
ncbi:hypothetical protein AQUCO_05200032v1 [Aquilegia coerulea]|uniref:Uncharacterized protein n=1 Tax=Aquilegia coerulea TaxID=218851 RepID=A0A2G5CIM5_AQUCA|nr:hypothetical protein AQUCO_05200032v1 [Aquilegia coerulea]PIA31151.1 hypothetical protein AQUCO_05200032v1 [Aquilegia coerulea]